MEKYKCNYNNNVLSLWQGGLLVFQEYIAELDLLEDRIAEIEESGIVLTEESICKYIKKISYKAS